MYCFKDTATLNFKDLTTYQHSAHFECIVGIQKKESRNSYKDIGKVDT